MRLTWARQLGQKVKQAQGQGHPWRDSASVIVVARDESKSTEYDYKLVMLRRSSKSKFMPNAYVFPGGATDKVDFDGKWRNVFNQYGGKECIKRVEEWVQADEGKDAAKRPFLMANKDEEQFKDDLKNRDLSFRLCAVRETFEEAGLFLHHPQSKKINHDLLSDYRKKVDQDTSALLRLCADTKTVPDVSGLYELACWLTPLGREDTSGRRFDTIFYTYFLEEERITSADQTEVTNLVWTDPRTIMEEAKKGELWLAPPQVYELSRLKEVNTFDKLKAGCEAFAKKRVLPSWLPQIAKLKDCHLSILPGDELYPENPDFKGEKWEGGFPEIDMTLEEVNEKHSQRMNRIAILSLSDVRVYVSPDIASELSLKT